MQVCEWHITEPLALVTTKKHDECAPAHDFPPSWIMRWIKSEGKRRREPQRMTGIFRRLTRRYNDSGWMRKSWDTSLEVRRGRWWDEARKRERGSRLLRGFFLADFLLGVVEATHRSLLALQALDMLPVDLRYFRSSLTYRADEDTKYFLCKLRERLIRDFLIKGILDGDHTFTDRTSMSQRAGVDHPFFCSFIKSKISLPPASLYILRYQAKSNTFLP